MVDLSKIRNDLDDAAALDAADDAAKAAQLADVKAQLDAARANDTNDAVQIADLKSQVAALQAKLNPPPVRTGTLYEKLPVKSTVTATANQAGAGATVNFPAGTYQCADFGEGTPGDTEYGMFFQVLGIIGVPGQTILQMVPGSSTKAAKVPVADWSINRYNLARIGGGGTLTPATVVQGITAKATEQGHLYNGWSNYRTAGSRYTDCAFIGFPGNKSIPPGETFCFTNYRCSDSLYTRCTFDGAGVGAAAFGASYSTNVAMQSCFVGNTAASAGATFLDTVGITLTDVKARACAKSSLNFERCGGVILLTRVDLDGNDGRDITLDSNTAPAKMVIADPVLTPAHPKIRIKMHPTYALNGVSSANTQQHSDVTLTVAGVSRPDLIEWV